MTNHTRILLALMSLPKIGPSTARKIVNELTFSVKTLTDFSDLVEDLILNKKFDRQEQNNIQRAFDHAHLIEELSNGSGIRMVSIFDHQYPERLKRLRKPPVLLHSIGNFSILNKGRNCAVIGTRNPSPHGYEYGLRISKKLAEKEFAVVSGLALGCDTAGHRGCLDGGGKTIAVLAQGLNQQKIYPKENRELAKQIVDMGGLLLSEYAVDQSANQSFFIDRDRIQAGLSDFLFVVETGLKGGTWHTINFALESNIPISTYSHPEKYRATEQSFGNQKLIAEGKATGIYALEDLEAFIEMVYANKVVNRIESISSADHIVPKNQQQDSHVQKPDQHSPSSHTHKPNSDSHQAKYDANPVKDKKKGESKGANKKGIDSSQGNLF